MVKFDATVDFSDVDALKAELATKLALAGVSDGQPMSAVIRADNEEQGEIYVGEEEFELNDDDIYVIGSSADELAQALNYMFG